MLKEECPMCASLPEGKVAHGHMHIFSPNKHIGVDARERKKIREAIMELARMVQDGRWMDAEEHILNILAS